MVSQFSQQTVEPLIKLCIHPLKGTSAVHGFTIAGGYSAGSDIDNVETTFDGSSFSDKTPLHDRTEQACLSFIDENSFIIAGGATNELASSSALTVATPPSR